MVRTDWVITAAHCLHNSPRLRMPGELRQRVGVLNRSLAEESQQETRVALQYITQTVIQDHVLTMRNTGGIEHV